MDKKLIAVILGGSSSERQVSIKTGTAVAEAINRNKYEVVMLDGANSSEIRLLAKKSPYQSFEDYLSVNNVKPDLMFLCLHGKGGEDGQIQKRLDDLNIKYTSSDAEASAKAMNKDLTLQICRKAGINTAKSILVDPKKQEIASTIMQHLSLPVIVKPNAQGSSFGISLCRKSAELSTAIANAANFDSKVLVEEFISGRELTVAVVGNHSPKALPAIEIIPQNSDFFDYSEKYNESGAKEVCPAEISAEISGEASKMAVLAHLALGLKGISRTDIIVENNTEKLYFLEVNTIPGMTPTSLLPKAAKANGWSFAELVQVIIDLAFE